MRTERPYPNAVAAESIQQEFDLQMAEMLLSSETVTEGEMEFGAELEFSEIDPGAAMHAAKERFIQEFGKLEKGQDAQPAVQNFLPAALLALRPVIRVVLSMIGRSKIVGFISGLLAKLVQRWVDP